VDAMLTFFAKKKLTEVKVAKLFAHAVQAMIDNGFDDIVGLINDSPEFVHPPRVSPDDVGPFTLVVLAGNMHRIPDFFESGQDKRIAEHILEHFAAMYELDKMELGQMVGDTRKFMMRKNHPSKNVSTAMAKTLFCRYGLNEFQEAYFKSLDAPNPIFIQRLREALDNFLWDWQSFQLKHKVVA
jgi:hypothetical protein